MLQPSYEVGEELQHDCLVLRLKPEVQFDLVSEDVCHRQVEVGYHPRRNILFEQALDPLPAKKVAMFFLVAAHKNSARDVLWTLEIYLFQDPLLHALQWLIWEDNVFRVEVRHGHLCSYQLASRLLAFLAGPLGKLSVNCQVLTELALEGLVQEVLVTFGLLLVEMEDEEASLEEFMKRKVQKFANTELVDTIIRTYIGQWPKAILMKKSTW